MDLPKGTHDLALRPDRHGSCQADHRHRWPASRATCRCRCCTPALPNKVAEYTRKLIDEAGEGGGFILDIGAVADEGKDENLEVMIKTAKEYGVY